MRSSTTRACPNERPAQRAGGRHLGSDDHAAVVHLSAASRVELGLVSEGSRHRVEDTEVEQLLLTLSVRVVPFGQHHLHWALHGWRRYGKGRHRAGLNLGDCFSYGLAMALDLPLLFKGDDFAHTDVKCALSV
jgi:ribonuclease VapC